MRLPKTATEDEVTERNQYKAYVAFDMQKPLKAACVTVGSSQY